MARRSVIRLERGVYVSGPPPVSTEERAAAVVVVTNGVACGQFAARLLQLDGAVLVPPFAAVPLSRNTQRRRGVWAVDLEDHEISTVNGLRCTSPLRTMLDLARFTDDDRWEQALESALRKRMITLAELEGALAYRRVGNARIRRVLRNRGDGPPTESLLETLAVQLMRRSPRIPTPARQVEVLDAIGAFQGRVDLAFPEQGLFLELDGQQHQGQPVYDATRQTRVVTTTQWLVGRFTWDEIVRNPKTTLRRLEHLLDAAKARRSRV